MQLPVGHDKTKYMISIRVRSGSIVHIMKASSEYVVIMVSIARHFLVALVVGFRIPEFGFGFIEYTLTYMNIMKIEK